MIWLFAPVAVCLNFGKNLSEPNYLIMKVDNMTWRHVDTQLYGCTLSQLGSHVLCYLLGIPNSVCVKIDLNSYPKIV